MRRRQTHLNGVFARAALEALFAAVLEIAVVRHIDRIRHLAGDRIEFVDLLADDGLRRHQTDGIGVRRVREDLLGGPFFDDLARVHDHDVVRHLRDDAEVVGDEHDRTVDPVLQIAEQVEDLRLDGHVERRGRLVCDDQFRVAGERHRDHDALPHTARQFVGVHPVDALAVGDPDHLEQFDGPRLDLFGRHFLVVQFEHLADLIADPEHGVQTGHRLLEDHRDLVAAQVRSSSLLK